MMGGQGKGYDSIIFLCIVIGIPLYIIGNYMTPILIIGTIILAIVIVVAIGNSKEQSKQLENIVSTELIGRTNIYKEGFEHTGFSIGTSGHGRAYFGKRKRFQGVEATFYVRYSDKSPKTISVMGGTEQYFKLLSYLGKSDETARNEDRKERSEPAPKIQERQEEQLERFSLLEADCQVKCNGLWKKSSRGDFQPRHLRGRRFSLSVNKARRDGEKGTL